MFGRKEELPKPSEQIEALKQQLKDLQAEAEAEEQQQALIRKEFKKGVQPPQGRIIKKSHPPDLEDVTSSRSEITNLELLEALNEHHVKMLTNFDRIYFKIDQTQDMIINMMKKGDGGKKDG